MRVHRTASHVTSSAIACVLATHPGCNAAFELTETRLFDAPALDAPPSCPDGAAPGFTGIAIEEFAQTCFDYTFAARAGLAVGWCFVTSPATGPGYRISSDCSIASSSYQPGQLTVNAVASLCPKENASTWRNDNPAIARYRRLALADEGLPGSIGPSTLRRRMAISS
jgi:hypothetical protein